MRNEMHKKRANWYFIPVFLSILSLSVSISFAQLSNMSNLGDETQATAATNLSQGAIKQPLIIDKTEFSILAKYLAKLSEYKNWLLVISLIAVAIGLLFVIAWLIRRVKKDELEIKKFTTSTETSQDKKKISLAPQKGIIKIKVRDKIKIPKSKSRFLDRIKNVFKKKSAESQPEKKVIVQPDKTSAANVKQIKVGFLDRIKNVFTKKRLPYQQSRIEFYKRKYKKEQQRKLNAQARRQRLKDYIGRAGIDISPQKLFKIFFNTAVLINLLISSYLIYYFSENYGITWSTVFVSLLVLWVFIFVFLIFAIWIMFYLFVDLRIFKRKLDIEDVLPDFLQLTASNINAGMTIDRALWFAVRPRFGVLAKEIESIAKDTVGGADLKTALEKFASRYDSVILRRSINMLNEGIEAGGRIGELLNRIAVDLQEQKSMIKEMTANVTTYVIFITFATIIATPFLFAMSGVLIDVVQTLGSTLGSTSSVAASAGIPLSFSSSGITFSDFKIFAIVSLTLTSLFSAMMVATIRKGNIKSSMKYIPIFIAISLTLYLVAQSLARKLLTLFF